MFEDPMARIQSEKHRMEMLKNRQNSFKDEDYEDGKYSHKRRQREREEFEEMQIAQ